MMRCAPLLSVLLVSLAVQQVSAQKKPQLAPRPNAPVAKQEILKLTGNKEAELSKDVQILWLYGPEDHRGGEHDYIRIKERFVPMLKTVPRVTVDEAFRFPSQAQFDKADVLIQFLHMPDLTAEQLQMYKSFVERGGGVVSIHESCIMRPAKRAGQYAECIGCSWKGNKESKWSKFDHSYPLFLNTKHPAFVGLPKSIRFNDESYWNLITRDNVEAIGALAPQSLESKVSFSDVLKSEDARSHAFWTYQSGKGRVFGTTTGHYTYTYFDPMYRLLLMRGLAWTLNEDPAPFMPLVFQGITNDKGLVGTTDSMLDYKNRKR
ncbi:ThuA domain-containing protein [bacterium]|nr:ThuA domain-containing protein [bacterium]